MTDCSNQCHPDCHDTGGSGHAKWIPLVSLSAPIFPSTGMSEDRFDFRDTAAEPEDGGGDLTRGGDDTPMADEDHKHWIDIVSFGGGTAGSGDGVEDGFLF
jgi:hypothetical protein